MTLDTKGKKLFGKARETGGKGEAARVSSEDILKDGATGEDSPGGGRTGGACEGAGDSGEASFLERIAELEAKLVGAEERLESVSAERDTWQGKATAIYDQYQRAKGDFDAFRKRTERDFEDRLTRSKADYLRAILDVLDNFDRFLQAASKGGLQDRNFEAFHKGISMVYKQLLDVLAQEGIEEVPDPVGKPMDPSVHEAIVAVDGSGDHGVVLEVLQKGYVYKGLVLRAAKVKVAR